MALRIYVAGPMRGIRLFNFPAFDDAKHRLLGGGYDVVSPADLDRDKGFDPDALPEDWDWNKTPENFSLRKAIDRDLDAVKACDCIYMLKGWQNSVGARAEKAVAEWMGLPVEYEEPQPETETISTLEGASAADRKGCPVVTGFLDYFPNAAVEVARVSKAGNDQHNPGQALHWDKTKSSDHADCIGRHLIQRGTIDNDKQRHSAKVAWRAMALLEEELTSGGSV